MNGSNGSYSYSITAPSTITEGDRRLVIKAYTSQGLWREADTFVTIKRPDLPIYTDAGSATVSSWSGNMTPIERTSGGPEGAKYAEFAFGNGGGSHGGLDFNIPKDFRPYKYLVVSYKGPTTGHPIAFTIGSNNTWGTNRYLLPAVTDWTTLAIPMYSVTKGSAMEKKTANSIHFWLDTSNGSGTFCFDNFYATSLPGAVQDIPTSLNPSAVKSIKSSGAFKLNLHGRLLELTVPSYCSFRINDLHGRIIKTFKNDIMQRTAIITVPVSGIYLVEYVNNGDRLVKSVVCR
jgi:hypothetical protein